MARDFYEILGVGKNADQSEIQRAYRKLARQHHPDVNKDPSAEARFKDISEAYDVLSDPEQRKRYDAFGENFRRVPPEVSPEEWRRARAYAGATPGGGGGQGAGGPFRSGPDLVRRLITLGLLEITRDADGGLWFEPSQVSAMARIQRLHRELNLNYASLGLIIDLLDRIAQLERLQRRPHSRSAGGRGGDRWT